MGQEQSSSIDESIPSQTLQDRSIKSVAKHIKDGRAKRVVVMVGAGISTSAGIPDFRSPDTGLYANLSRSNLPYAEAVFDISYFRNNPLPFYTLAHELYPGKYRPTISHSFVRLLSDKGLLLKLFTQNIDCLDREAGVPADKIVEAHGSFAQQRCIECKTSYPSDLMKLAISKRDVPHCLTPQCNGLVKPDIVFFGEQLPENFHTNRDLPRTADLCIVMGTSLTVQPFASLPGFCSDGVPRVLINLEQVGGLGSRTDDVIVLEDCDAGVRKLAAALGWEEELQALWDDTKAMQIAFDGSMEKPQQKSKDENLEDRITSLTEEVEKSLKITNAHRNWLEEHLSKKQAKWDQGGESAPPAESVTPNQMKADMSSAADEETPRATTSLRSTSDGPFKASGESVRGSETSNTPPDDVKKPKVIYLAGVPVKL